MPIATVYIMRIRRAVSDIGKAFSLAECAY
jgi:hypothetical protein